MTGDVLLDMLVAAMLTILCYSSLAVVLLVATLASLHVFGLPVALGLVLDHSRDARWPPPGWVVLACDVGQGDAILLQV